MGLTRVEKYLYTDSISTISTGLQFMNMELYKEETYKLQYIDYIKIQWI